MSSNTANMVIFVLMVLLPLAAVLALEVFLSRRPSWWPGLVLPCSVTLGAFNMIRLMALNFLLAQPTLGGGILHAGLFILAVRDLFSQSEKGAAEVRRSRKRQAPKVKEIPLAAKHRSGIFHAKTLRYARAI